MTSNTTSRFVPSSNLFSEEEDAARIPSTDDPDFLESLVGYPDSPRRCRCVKIRIGETGEISFSDQIHPGWSTGSKEEFAKRVLPSAILRRLRQLAKIMKSRKISCLEIPVSEEGLVLLADNKRLVESDPLNCSRPIRAMAKLLIWFVEYNARPESSIERPHISLEMPSGPDERPVSRFVNFQNWLCPSCGHWVDYGLVACHQQGCTFHQDFWECYGCLPNLEELTPCEEDRDKASFRPSKHSKEPSEKRMRKQKERKQGRLIRIGSKG